MTAGDMLAFLGVAALVIATPGQDTALSVRNTLVGGRRAGLSTALGVCTGQAIWAVFTSLGVSAVIVASESAFATLRMLGSGFLLFLGGRAVVEVMRSSNADAAPPDDRYPHRHLTASTALRQGLLSNVLNPKMLAFFTSLLPQFAKSFPALLALGLVFSLMTLIWLSGYTLAVAKAAPTLRKPRVRHAIEAMTGIVLIALGGRLAMEGGWR